jgi:ABC-type phosphate transport system permease subunit
MPKAQNKKTGIKPAFSMYSKMILLAQGLYLFALPAAGGSLGTLASWKLSWPTGLINCSVVPEDSPRLPLFTKTINNKITIRGTKKLANTMMMSCFGFLIRFPCSLLIGIYFFGGFKDICRDYN